MIYKQYGQTGLKVSAIGLGGMRLNDEDILAGNYEKCAEVVSYAFDNGINYFDTAPFYNHDKSESIIGMALSKVPRSDYYLTTKTNLKTLRHNYTLDGFRRRLETSLERLKVDYIDFYNLWCMLDVNSFNKNCDLLYRFFEQVKDEGLIKHIVMSSHMQGEELEYAVNTGLFEGILVGYNVLNYKYRQKGIEAAYRKNMGIGVMNPLGGGIIARNPSIFNFLTDSSNLTITQAALRFVASHKEISVTLTGATTKEHIDDAVKAVENLKEKPMVEVCKEYENKGITLNNLCTGCGYCNPCPKDIDIPKLMMAYNSQLLGNSIMHTLRHEWFLTPETASKCIRCGKCESACTQHLPIRERMKEISLIGQ